MLCCMNVCPCDNKVCGLTKLNHPACCLCSLLARGFPSSRSTQGYYCGGGSERCCTTCLKFPSARCTAIAAIEITTTALGSHCVLMFSFIKLISQSPLLSSFALRIDLHPPPTAHTRSYPITYANHRSQMIVKHDRRQIHWFSSAPLKRSPVSAWAT